MTKRMIPLLILGIALVFLAVWWFTPLSPSMRSALFPASTWEFKTDESRIEVDTKHTGQIIRWEYDGKVLVDAKTPTSPLEMESADGQRGVFTAREASVDPESVRVRGVLKIGESQTDAEVAYHVSEKGRRITVGFQIEEPVMSMQEVKWNLPLALSPRKRIWLRGDYGYEWDTRYFYQFTVGAKGDFMKHADRNEWRYFGLDQIGSQAARLWKSESETTSPLVMQEGRAATPAVQIYNANGGLFVEFPQMAGEAARSLRVDAAKGGQVSALLWTKSFLPVAPHQTGIFGVSHEVILTASNSEPAALAAQKEVAERYPARPKPSADLAMQEDWWVREAPLSSTIQYVTGGYPFAPGELKDVAALQVKVSGQAVPTQAKALAFWPDGSIKWALLTFPIDSTKAVSASPAPSVSLRNGKFLPVEIVQGVMPVPAHAKLKIEQAEPNSVKIVNGDWQVELGTGEKWLRSMEYQGRPLLRESGGIRLAYSDYLLNPEKVLPFERKAQGGTADPGVLTVEKMTVEESGSLRAIVRMEGLTNNREPTRIILRVEILAGLSELRITHTAEFRFKDPRKTFLTGLGLEFPFAAIGNEKSMRQILQRSLDSREERTKRDGQWTVTQQSAQANGWLQLETDQMILVGAIRNLQKKAPKALTADFANGALRFELWPDEAGPMDVRRYSNFPHLGQGETVTDDPAWVTDFYYQHDPFVGISRTHEVFLGFWPTKTAANVEAVVADFESPPILYAGWDRYQTTGVVLPEPSQSDWPHAWQGWTALANFCLWHQIVHQWYGFWNYGDFGYHFQTGYGWNPPPKELVAGRPWENSGVMVKDRRLDYFPPNDWPYDNGRWGWGNTEGQQNRFLQHEFLRYGNRAVYFASEALARLSRDVVIRHEGEWFGAGTRHGVQHWSDGHHTERQISALEYRTHYFLSGDGRSLDTLNKLYEGVFSKKPVSAIDAHGARLAGLLMHWETTGSSDEAEQLRRYVHAFLSHEGIYCAPNVKFPGAVVAGEPKMLNDGMEFYNYFGTLHGLVEYEQITQDPKLATALIAMADAALNNPESQKRYKTGQNGGFEGALGFAALRAPNPEPYRKLLENHILSGGWKYFYQPTTTEATHWTGHSGYIFQSMWSAWTIAANWTPYLAKSLASKEIWTPAIESQFKKIETDGNPHTKMRESWQNDFDNVPGLENYLGSQQPWISKTLPKSAFLHKPQTSQTSQNALKTGSATKP